MAGAASFTGMIVKLTLKEPAGTSLYGTVAQVIPETSTLCLEHVSFPQTNQKFPQWRVVGTQIEHLELVQATKNVVREYPVKRAESNGLQQQQTAQVDASMPIPVRTPQEEFVDPAIVSFRSHNQQHIVEKPGSDAGQKLTKEVQPQPIELSDSQRSGPGNSTLGSRKQISVVRYDVVGREDKDIAATLTAPFSGMDIGSLQERDLLEETDGPPLPQDRVRRVSLNKTRSGKPMDDPGTASDPRRKSRRGPRKLKKEAASHATQDTVANAQTSSPEAVRKHNGNMYKGRGWRQTPILQDSSTAVAQVQGAITGRTGRQGASSTHRSRKQRAMELEAERNGWATEDATDIQDLPDFDFESNLSKFDKLTVFDQMRHDDAIAESDRLVNFNRLPRARPGTYGGKNLHPTENVLDGPHLRSRRQSAMSSDSDSTLDFATLIPRRNQSKASSSRVPTCSNSGLHDDDASVTQPPRGVRSIPRPAYAGSVSYTASCSPNPNRPSPPLTPSLLAHQQPGGHFRITGSNRPCPTITPGGLAAVEEVAEMEFGLTVELMNENAGRGIAAIAMQLLNADDRRRTRDNAGQSSRPLALFLVGNHRAGARALAAARHLRGRSVKVMACIIGLDRPNLELEKGVRKQKDLLLMLGAVVRGWPDVREYLTQLDAQPQSHGYGHGCPDIVVDALLSPIRSYDALTADDQRSVAEMITWSNRTPDRIVLSVDMPSGINGSTGEADTLLDGPAGSISLAPTAAALSAELAVAAPLELRTKHIACIGAPRVGLLRALQRASSAAVASDGGSNSTGGSSDGNNTAALHPPRHEGRDWQLWAVDIGVNKAWKRYGVAGGVDGGVKFGDDWVVQLEFVEDGKTRERMPQS